MSEPRYAGITLQPVPTGSTTGARSLTDFLCLLTYGIGFVLLAVVVYQATKPSATPEFISGLYVAASLTVLLAATLSRRTGLLTLIVAYFFAVFIAIPAAIQTRQDIYPFGDSATYTSEQLTFGLLALALGQLALLAGMGLVSAHYASKPKTPGLLEQETTQLSLRPALQMSLVFTAVAAVLGVLAGPAALFAARADDVEAASMRVQALLIGRSCSVVALLLCTLAIRCSADHKQRQSAWLCMIPVAAVVLVVNFPPALPRFHLLGMLLAVVVLLFNFRRPIVKLSFVILSTFFLLYLFAAVKDLRASSLAQSFSANAFAQWDPRRYLLSEDFDGFKQTVDTLVYFSEAPLRGGANFLGVLLFWVPRSVWPGKPVHTGQVVSEGLGYWYTNVSNPLVAEAFAAWGWIGVIVVLLIAGILIMRLERSSRTSGAISVPSLTLYAVATGYAVILLRGALNAVAPMICTAFVLAAIVALVYRRDRARREDAALNSVPTPVARPWHSKREPARTDV